MTTNLVLLALSKAQRDGLESELARLARPGVELVFEESEAVALDLVGKRSPALVIVGMSIGMMDGLEFVAVLFKKHPAFRGKVVVLPDKGDPFPPVVQWRDPATGKSSTENTDFAGIEKLVASLESKPQPKPEPKPETKPKPIASPPVLGRGLLPRPAPRPKAPEVAAPAKPAEPTPPPAAPPEPVIAGPPKEPAPPPAPEKAPEIAPEKPPEEAPAIVAAPPAAPVAAIIEPKNEPKNEPASRAALSPARIAVLSVVALVVLGTLGAVIALLIK